MRTLKLLSCLLLSLFAAPALAQQPQMARAELLIDAPSITQGETIWAAVRFTITPGWHIYWRNPGDSGMPTELRWNPPSGITAGEILWPAPERVTTGEFVNYGYSDEAVFLVPLTPAQDGITGTVTVMASWLVCQDICIPESATLTAALPAGNTQARNIIAEAREALPKAFAGQALYEHDGALFQLYLKSDAGWPRGNVAWIPEKDGIITNAAAQETQRDGNTLLITIPVGFAAPEGDVSGVLRVGDAAWDVRATADAIPTIAPSGPVTPLSLVLALGLAFLGGLLLNLMPCVLPILSLKCLALAKRAHASPREARVQGVAYTTGVVLSFLLIALLMLGLKSTGAAIGWGFQLQQPGVLMALYLLMLLIALNLFGWFELPVLFGRPVKDLKQESSIGSFLTGALAVAVATPCTAPFMATAIGATLAMKPLPTLLVFASLGIGMALPFLLVSLWPAARAALPKPGAWMERLRQLLAFPMLATAAWLLTVLVAVSGMQGLIVAFTSGILLAFLVWLTRLSMQRGARMLLLLAMLLLAAYAVANVSPQHAGTEQASAEMGEPFDLMRLDALRKEGKPVFVDATAAWCITCKINERVALRSDRVRAYFAEQGVTLLVADWTTNDPVITAYLATFGRNGVPLYVFYPPQGEPVILPQLLTPELVLDTLRVHMEKK